MWQYDEKTGQIVTPKQGLNQFNIVMMVLDSLLSFCFLVLAIVYFALYTRMAEPICLLEVVSGIAGTILFGAIAYHLWIYRRD